MSTVPILQGPVDRRVSLLRAGSVGSNQPPKLTVEVHEQIYEVGSLEEARALHLGPEECEGCQHINTKR